MPDDFDDAGPPQLPNFDLRGRNALVTGAGRGIALGIVRALAGAGAAVAIQDIDEDAANRAVEALKKGGAHAVALGGDVSDPTVADALVGRAVDALARGPLHVLVNSASVQSHRPFGEWDADECARVFNTNQTSMVLLTQKAVEQMKRARWGRVLNVSSVQAGRGDPNMLPYAMSRGAILPMTHGLAARLGEFGITVNQISPGYVHTLRNAEQGTYAEANAKIGPSIPLRRVGRYDDCAGAALLLCSEAGSWITGQNLGVDGGWTA